jgi:hypothetical protein
MSMPCREQIGYLVYRFDDMHPGDRTRDDYLALADEILAVVADPGNFDEVLRHLIAPDTAVGGPPPG